MQSIDELARVITQLEPSDQRALLDKVAQLNLQKARADGADSRLHVMQEAMRDELFLADLREVMEDFRYVNSEKTPRHDTIAIEISRVPMSFNSCSPEPLSVSQRQTLPKV